MRTVLYLTLGLLFAPVVKAQHSVGTIQGHVALVSAEDADDLSIKVEEVTTEATIESAEIDSSGNFVVRNLPFATYDLYLLRRGHSVVARRVVVSSAIPVNVIIDSIPSIQGAEVTITDTHIESTRPTVHTLYTAPVINRLPVTNPAKAIESILLWSPGVVPDEDGRLHMRGEDAMLQYVIDGIPIVLNQTRVYAPLLDANLIESADLLRGSLSPEYGVATSGVLNVTTKSGFDAPSFANASYSFGSFDNSSKSANYGGHFGQSFAYFIGYSNFSSSRYLDPISGFEPNHTNGSGSDYFGKLNAIISDNADLTVLGSYSKTNYDVPNGVNPDGTPDLLQDQSQDLSAYMIGARFNYSLTPSSVLSLLGYTNNQESEITSNGILEIRDSATLAIAKHSNEKYFIGGHRINTTTGGQLEYSLKTDWLNVPNQFKAGVGAEVYPLSEFLTFGVTDSSIASPNVPGGDTRLAKYDLTRGGTPFLVDTSATGKRYSAYLQDEITAGAWTINGGLRFDMYDMLEKESGISPRVNAIYRASDDLVLRASYNRMFMQAPIENILVSSSAAARALADTVQANIPTIVQSEKSHVVEIGAGYRLNNFVSLDLTGYGKLIDDFVVKVELGNSGVIFPANIRQGIVAGGDLEVLLRNWNNFTGRLSFSTTVSKGVVPDNGESAFAAGLVLGEEGQNYLNPWKGEDMFNTEHNQLLTAAFLLRYDLPIGVFGQISGRFDSGLPFDLVDPVTKQGLDPDASRAELKRRGYSDAVIDMLELTSEQPGSPDKSVAPHAVFDLSAGADLSRFGLPVKLTGIVLNVLDTKYLYKFESSFGGTHYGVPRSYLIKAELVL
jgi:outer membrane receptor protein involved in Fe transport